MPEFIRTSTLQHYSPHFRGDPQAQWDSLSEETRTQWEDYRTYKGGDPTAAIAVMTLRPFLGDVYGVDDAEVADNFHTYSTDLAVKLGLKPEVELGDIYYRVSEMVKEMETKQKRREDAARSSMEAAIAGEEPDFSKLSTTDDPGLRVLVADVYSQQKAKVDKVAKKYERLIGKTTLDYTGKIVGEQFTDDELKDFIANAPDDEFDLVLAMAHSRAPKEAGKDKATVKNIAEEMARVSSGIIKAPNVMIMERHAEEMERRIESGGFIRVGDENADDVVPEELRSPLRLLNNTFGNLYASAGLSFKTHNATEEERAELQKQIKLFRRVSDRDAAIRQLAEGKIDPTRNGKALNDYLVNVAGMAPFMGTAMVPGVGMPLLGIYIGEQNFRELQAKYSELEMPRETALNLAMTSGLVEAASERAAALVTFGRFRAPRLDSYLKRLVVGFAVENVQEGAQDLILPAVQEVYQLLDEEIPSVDWDNTWSEWWDQRPEVALTLLPYSLLGALAKQKQPLPKELVPVIEAMLEDEGVLRGGLGMSEKDVKKLKAATTLDGKLDVFNKADKPGPMANDTTPQKKAFRQKLLDKGFAATEQEAEAHTELADAVFRRVAQEQGITVEEVYNRVGLTREEGQGDLMQQGVRVAGQKWRQAFEAQDEAGMQAAVDEAAAAAGFNVGPMLHGTTKEFNTFKEGGGKRLEQFSFGFHFTDSPDLAAKYGDRQITAFLSVKNTLDVEQAVYRDSKMGQWLEEVAPKTVFFPEGGREVVWLKNALDALPAEKARKAIVDAGYDSLTYKAEFAELGVNSRAVLAEGKTYIVFNPNQIKSADPVTYDDAGNPIPLEERFGPAPDIRYQSVDLMGVDELAQAAYHGTPFEGDIDQFSTDYIGTGENTTNEGWGLYFAEQEGTGRWYQQTLSGPPAFQFSVDGLPKGWESLRAYLTPGRIFFDRDWYRVKEGAWDNGKLPVEKVVQRLGAVRDAGLYDDKWLAMYDGDTNVSAEEWSQFMSSEFWEPLATSDRKVFNLNYHFPDAAVMEASLKAEGRNVQRVKVGGLYSVELDVDESNTLHWNARLNEQHPDVLETLRDIAKDWEWDLGDEFMTGRDFYNGYASILATAGDPNFFDNDATVEAQKAASKALLADGIRGIRYVDGISQKNWIEGKDVTHNYVIFDGKYVKDVRRLEQGKKGYIRFMEDGKALIGLTEKGDASTFIHELGHFARRYALADKHLQTLGDYYGVDEATGKWDVQAEERFARDFERYVYDGKLPDNADSKLKKAFKVLKDLMRAIYETLKGSPIGANLDPEVRSAIDSIFEGSTPKTPQLSPIETIKQSQLPEGTYIPTVEQEEDLTGQGVDVLFQEAEGQERKQQFFGDKDGKVYISLPNETVINRAKEYFDGDLNASDGQVTQAFEIMDRMRRGELNFAAIAPGMHGLDTAVLGQIMLLARKRVAQGDHSLYDYLRKYANELDNITEAARKMQMRGQFSVSVRGMAEVEKGKREAIDRIGHKAGQKSGTSKKLEEVEKAVDDVRVDTVDAPGLDEIVERGKEKGRATRKASRKKKTPIEKLEDEVDQEAERLKKLNERIKKIQDNRVKAYIKKFSEAGSDPPLYEETRQKQEDELGALVRKQLGENPYDQTEFLEAAEALGIEDTDALYLYNSTKDEHARRIKIKEMRQYLRDLKKKRNDNQAQAERILASLTKAQSDTPDLVRQKHEQVVRKIYRELLQSKAPISREMFMDALRDVNVSPETAGKLYDVAMVERDHIAMIDKARTPGRILNRSLGAIKKALLRNPLLYISSADKRIEIATEVFVDGGMARPDAEHAARMFLDEFTRKLAEARISLAEDMIKRAKGPFAERVATTTLPKSKKGYYQRILEIIRAGALDGRIRLSEEIAKENGWVGFTDEQVEQLMRYDEQLSDPDITSHEAVEVQMAISSLITSSNAPLKLRDVLNAFVTTNIFSGVKTMMLQVSPVFSSHINMWARDLPLALKQGNIDGWLLAMGRYYKAFPIALREAQYVLNTGFPGKSERELIESAGKLDQLWEQTMAAIHSKSRKSPYEKAVLFRDWLIGSNRLVMRPLAALDAANNHMIQEYAKASAAVPALKALGHDANTLRHAFTEAMNLRAVFEQEAELKQLAGYKRLLYVNDRVETTVLKLLEEKNLDVEGLQKFAATEASVGLGTKDVEGLLGPLMETLQNYMRPNTYRGAFFRLMIGVVRTPFNIVNSGLDWTPLGFMRQLHVRRTPADQSLYPVSYGSPELVERRLMETMVGSSIMAANVLAWFLNRDEEPEDQWYRINLNGPRIGTAEREVWEKQGRKNYTVQFKIAENTWATMGFRNGGLENWNMLLTVPALFEQSAMDPHYEDNKWWVTMNMILTNILGEQVFPLRGMMRTRRGSVEGQQQQFARELGFRASALIPSASFWKTFDKFKNYQEANTFKEAFRQQMPFSRYITRAEDAINNWGDELGGAPQDYLDTVQRLGLPFGVTSEARITPEQKDLWPYAVAMAGGKPVSTRYSKKELEKMLEREVSFEEYRKIVIQNGKYVKEAINARFPSAEKLEAMSDEEFDKQWQKASRESLKRLKSYLNSL